MSKSWTLWTFIWREYLNFGILHIYYLCHILAQILLLLLIVRKSLSFLVPERWLSAYWIQLVLPMHQEPWEERGNSVSLQERQEPCRSLLPSWHLAEVLHLQLQMSPRASLLTPKTSSCFDAWTDEWKNQLSWPWFIYLTLYSDLLVLVFE